MSITLLSAVTAQTVGSSTQLTASPVESFVLTISSAGPFTASVSIEQSSDNVTYTIIKTWNVNAVRGYSDSFSVDVPTYYYVRSSVTAISGTSTSISVTASQSAYSTSVATLATDSSGNITGIVNPSGVGIVQLSATGSTYPYPLRKWQRALSNVRAGLANATIAFVGDSTTCGAFSNGTTAWTNNKALSYPTLLANTLTSIGIPTNLGSITSDNSTLGHSGNIPLYDPRVVSGASYINGTINTAGGQTIQTGVGSLGTLAQETFTFTPVDSFDTVEVYWYRLSGNGTFTIDCGGAVLATCSAGATGLQKTVVSKTAGTGLVNLIHTVAGLLLIVGINTYLSTSKRTQMFNLGWSGSNAGSWNDSSGTYSPLPVLSTYAPDLVVINLGINDAIAGSTTLVNYRTNLLAIVTSCLTYADVILVIPNYLDTTIASASNQQVVKDAINYVSGTLSVPVVDLQYRWGSYAIANTLGYMNTDKIHPKQIAYQDIANMLTIALTT